MLEFSGTEAIGVPADQVYNKLIDMDFVKAGIPDLVSADKVSDSEMRCKVKPAVSFLRGTLDVIFQLAERNKPSAKMSVKGKGIGASLEIETTMHVRSTGDGSTCEVEWTSEVVQLGGLLKAVSKGLIEGLATKVSRQVWDDLKKRLEEKA